MPVKSLPAKFLYRKCDPALLNFQTTRDIRENPPLPGQERAEAALSFGIGMKKAGFHIFALGPDGTGKGRFAKKMLEKEAIKALTPDDWCYLNNFIDPQKPKAVRLPRGRAVILRKDMETLVEDLKASLLSAFEGDEYRTRRQVIEDTQKERQEKAITEIQKEAATKDITLVRTPVGLALAPMKDGEVMPPDDFAKLEEEEQGKFKENIEVLQEKLEETLKQFPRWEKEKREKIRNLDREVAMFAVGHLIEEIIRHHQDLPEIVEYLQAVQKDVVDNLNDFLISQENNGEEANPNRPPRAKSSPFRRYKVNVLVHHEEGAGAPVVVLDHPTQPNLIGRIDHLAQYGALLTDFNLIKSGSLHRANGGYLLMDARKLLMQPFAWEDLKRALRTQSIKIEAPGQAMGLISTNSLEPDPIPLDVKVVLTGDPWLYYTLSHSDPEFAELFKVAADFDYQMPWSNQGVAQYVAQIATIARQEELRPLDPSGVARIIEHSAREAGSSEKLSTHISSLADLIREADYWAAREEAEIINRSHVDKAINEEEYRHSRVREHVLDEIIKGTVQIDTKGERIGQINGLSVMQLGQYSFGRPSRITCRVRAGRGELIDIEREVALGGPLHSKGVLILSSFLASRYSPDAPLSLGISLVFEQSYGGVDGDSASSAELYALLSALAQVPIRQNFAVTGSVSQYGEVQAIGGVNEKIEGFFDICKARGLTGKEGVLIPATNVKHLMLREDIVEAAKKGRFKIYPISHVDEGIELLTGIPAGQSDEKGEYPLGSVNRLVTARLSYFATKAATGGLYPANRGNKPGKEG